MLAGKHWLAALLLYISISLVCYKGSVTTAVPIGSGLRKYCSGLFGVCSGQSAPETESSQNVPPSYSQRQPLLSEARPLAKHDLPLDPSEYPNSGLPGAVNTQPIQDPSKNYGISSDTLGADPACSEATPNANTNEPRLDRCKHFGSSSDSSYSSEPLPVRNSPASPSMSMLQGPAVDVTSRNQRSNRFWNACSKLGNSVKSCFLGSPDTESTDGGSPRWRPSLSPIEESISQEMTPQASPQRQEAILPNGYPLANPIVPMATGNSSPQRTRRFQNLRCRFPNPFKGCRPNVAPESSNATPAMQYGSWPIVPSSPQGANHQIDSMQHVQVQQSSSPTYANDQQDAEEEEEFVLPRLGTRQPVQPVQPALPSIREETDQELRAARRASPSSNGVSQSAQSLLPGKRALDGSAYPYRYSKAPRSDMASRPASYGLSQSAQRYLRLPELPLQNEMPGVATSSIVSVDTPVNTERSAQNKQWSGPRSVRTIRPEDAWGLPYRLPSAQRPIVSSPEEQKRLRWVSSTPSSPLSPPPPKLTKEMLDALPVDERLGSRNSYQGTTSGPDDISHDPPSFKSAYYHSDGSVDSFDSAMSMLRQERSGKSSASTMPSEEAVTQQHSNSGSPLMWSQATRQQHGLLSSSISPLQATSQQDALNRASSPFVHPSNSDMFSGAAYRRRSGPSFHYGNGIAMT